MELLIMLLVASAAGLIGIAVGWFLRFIFALGKKGSMEIQIKEMLLEAKTKSEEITSEAEKNAKQILKEAKEEIKKEEDKIQKTQDRLIDKESFLDKRQSDIDKEFDEIKNDKEKISELERNLEEIIKKKIKELQEITSLSKEDAKKELLEEIEKIESEDLNVRIQKLEISNKEHYENKAKQILVDAIQRVGTSVSSDIFTTNVKIENDDDKGKIIGKEGRNIKTFERETGVELLIDETPGLIIISTYDPIRREVAKLALQNLIKDGRIQPSRIEEEVKKAKKSVDKIVKEKGEQAAFEVGVFNLDPRVLLILGRLHFRTSYGQNVLRHSIEMAHLSGMIAEEIGVDVKTAKAGALLHDIGKAVDHEFSGSHVDIGRRILQKFNCDEKIIKAMQSHHEEYPFETPESVIVFVADSISGGRPGARNDSVENYMKRLEDLEEIAKSFDGIENSYALQAGREIRVFVKPNEIDDLKAKKIAREIAKKIEDDLKYPGEIKVTVIRENKIIDYAR